MLSFGIIFCYVAPPRSFAKSAARDRDPPRYSGARWHRAGGQNTDSARTWWASAVRVRTVRLLYCIVLCDYCIVLYCIVLHNVLHTPPPRATSQHDMAASQSVRCGPGMTLAEVAGYPVLIAEALSL